MNPNTLFSFYLSSKRQEKKMTLRELASKTGISHTYLYNIEKGFKAPPSDLVLIKIADALHLSEKEQKNFFDIAAHNLQQKDKGNYYLPADVSKYLVETKDVCEVVRAVKNTYHNGEFWTELLKNL